MKLWIKWQMLLFLNVVVLKHLCSVLIYSWLHFWIFASHFLHALALIRTGKLNSFYGLKFLSHSTKNCLLNHFSQWISPELKQVGRRVDRDEETWDTRKSSDSVQDSHTSLAVGRRDFYKWWRLLSFFFPREGQRQMGIQSSCHC